MTACVSKVPGVTRRAALAGIAAYTTASAAALHPAAAAIEGFVVIGQDDWLFPVFDEVRRLDVSHLRAVTQLIVDSVAILKRGGIETVISLTPAKSRIYRDYLPSDFQIAPEVEKRYAMALDLLGKPGILVPDLATPLLGLRKNQPDTALFFKADTHWTGAGAEPAAVELAAQIKAKIRLLPSNKPGTALGPVVTVRQANNDLADGLPDAIGAKYRPQSYPVHQMAQTQPGAALLDDDSADTLLVGNSFMQPKYGFASMLSNQLGRPVAADLEGAPGQPLPDPARHPEQRRRPQAAPQTAGLGFSGDRHGGAPRRGRGVGPECHRWERFPRRIA